MRGATSFSPCGRRWPSRQRGSDEGSRKPVRFSCSRLRNSKSRATPHPVGSADHPLPQGERGARSKRHVSMTTSAARGHPFSPCGRRWASRQRGPDEGSHRRLQLFCSPPTFSAINQTPHPVGSADHPLPQGERVFAPHAHIHEYASIWAACSDYFSSSAAIRWIARSGDPITRSFESRKTRKPSHLNH